MAPPLPLPLLLVLMLAASWCGGDGGRVPFRADTAQTGVATHRQLHSTAATRRDRAAATAGADTVAVAAAAAATGPRATVPAALLDAAAHAAGLRRRLSQQQQQDDPAEYYPHAPALPHPLPFARKRDYPTVPGCKFDVVSARCEPTYASLMTGGTLVMANSSEMSFGGW
eukprot:365427-Chlamydomonas_euryale.AAC.11